MLELTEKMIEAGYSDLMTWLPFQSTDEHRGAVATIYRAMQAARPSLSDEDVERMRGALTECRETFAFYVRHHEAKFRMSSDSGEMGNLQDKIRRNQAMVDLCDAALHIRTDSGVG